jgi:hypothetical protein
MTVTTPKPSSPNARDSTTCAANVAAAATTIPMMFWDVPERMFR